MSRSAALMFLLALTLPATVLAQSKDTADVHGAVLDASGRPVAGYPMSISTPQSGEVIIRPTDADGTFGVEGLPPGSYEVRVFEPGRSTDNPIASKQVTLAAGQKERIEIRLVKAAGLAAAGTTLVGIGVNWTAIQIAGMLLLAAFVVFYVVRAQRRPT